MEIDTITLKFAITCGLALAAIITAAVLCRRIERKIEAMQNLKDVEK